MRKGLSLALIALAAAWAPGCATTATGAAAAIVEADERMVEGCKFLGTVHAKPAIGSEGTARRSALEKAAKLGATHLVIEDVTSAGPVTFASVTARAYQCQPGGGS